LSADALQLLNDSGGTRPWTSDLRPSAQLLLKDGDVKMVGDPAWEGLCSSSSSSTSDISGVPSTSSYHNAGQLPTAPAAGVVALDESVQGQQLQQQQQQQQMNWSDEAWYV
jgi:hypothetical protein